MFLVMELLDGETLDARWERSGRRLEVREVVDLVLALLDVITAAHARGVVHRDLKPENLVLTRDGRLKVLDFGVARLLEASPTRTRTGAVFGTPAFMPPEQALGRTREVDALSDVWAVGATAFSLLSGRFVHDGETAEEMLVRSATEPAAPLEVVAPHVPAPLARVFDRALALEKRDRRQGAHAMRDALAQTYDQLASPRAAMASQDSEEKTRVAPPPIMTVHIEPPSSGPTAGTLVLPALPEATTVAGVATQGGGHAGKARPKRALLAIGAGIALAAVVAALAGTIARGVAPVPSASGAAAGDPAAAVLTPHATVGTSAPPSTAITTDIPSPTVEAPATAAHRKVPVSSPSSPTGAPAPFALATSIPLRTAVKRDPLAP